MVEENIGQEFRLKNINETRNYFYEEVNQNELMSKKHKKICTTLNYIEHFEHGYRMYFCFYFFDWYSYRNYEFSNRIKNLFNNCNN